MRAKLRPCVPAGKGALQVVRLLRTAEVPACAFLPDVGCMGTLRLVDRYRYLGSWICDTGSLAMEIKFRLDYARAALRPLRRPVFQREGVSALARTYLFRSLVLSRAIHNIGAWGGLQAGEWDAWQLGLLGLFKALIPRHLVRPEAHVTASAICGYAGLPAPAAIVRIERLRLLGQLVSVGAPSTMHLLEAAVGHRRCWLVDVRDDVAWMCVRLSVPSPFASDADLSDMWSWVSARIDSWHGLLVKLWQEAARSPDVDVRPPPASGLHPVGCRICKRQFKGKRGLAAHVAPKHGLRSRFRGLVSGTQCAACQVQFFTRSRLLKHVQRYSAGCRLFYLNFVARARRELTQEADGLERARLRQTRGRGRLDRAAARVERATAVTLAASDSEEEQLFYLEDLL